MQWRRSSRHKPQWRFIWIRKEMQETMTSFISIESNVKIWIILLIRNLLCSLRSLSKIFPSFNHWNVFVEQCWWSLFSLLQIDFSSAALCAECTTKSNNEILRKSKKKVLLSFAREKKEQVVHYKGNLWIFRFFFNSLFFI